MASSDNYSVRINYRIQVTRASRLGIYEFGLKPCQVIQRLAIEGDYVAAFVVRFMTAIRQKAV